MKRVPAEILNLALDIVRREGGFVNDPSDPGGATKYGVTIKTLRGLGMDIDGDGDVDIQDVKALTVDDAVKIFVDRYFYRPRIHTLPKQLWPVVFDTQVHSGANAIKLLQRTLNRVSRKIGFAPLLVDGVIGPHTQRAARMAVDAMGRYFVDSYAVARRDWLINLARRNPKLRKYVVRRDGGKGGWVVRAEEFMSPRYHLSEAAWRRIRKELGR